MFRGPSPSRFAIKAHHNFSLTPLSFFFFFFVMSAPSTSPAPLQELFGCEKQSLYKFSLHCKRSFRPSLTHQFELLWPWPPLKSTAGQQPQPQQGSGTVLAIDAASPAMKSDGADEAVDLAEEALDEEDDPAKPLWRNRRRYGRPTFILDFSSDPFMGLLETRRVGFLLSPGYRTLLPLIPLNSPEELPDKAGLAFWKTAYRASPSTTASSSTSPPPYCAELVLGELSAVEKLVRQRYEQAGPAAAASRRGGSAYVKPSFFSKIDVGPRTSAHVSAAPHGATVNDSVTGRSSSTSTLNSSSTASLTQLQRPAAALLARLTLKPVQSYFFYTLPFRVRWLSQLPGRLVVTLPCEERLVTLHAPHHGASDTVAAARRDGASATQPLPIVCVHSFALPRGVVPLETAEVFDRAFLAVGTYEHGVLLCHLNSTTGAIESVARVVSLKGHGSTFFPVTRLAALFPALPAASQAGATTSTASSSPPTPAWVSRAAALESLRDGVLLCSSPYEASAVLVKLDGAAEGVVEDFAALRGVETLLDVSPTVEPSLGPVFCTAARKVQWLRWLDPAEEEKLTVGRTRHSDVAVAERVRPAVLCDRMARLDYPLLRLMASPPVLQSFTSTYVSRHSYTKHWRFAVDNRNYIVLLDRTTSQYAFHSSFPLCRRGAAEQQAAAPPPGSVLTSTTATAGEKKGDAAPAAENKSGKSDKDDGAVQPEADASGASSGAGRCAKRGRPSTAAAAAAKASSAQRKAAHTAKQRIAARPNAAAEEEVVMEDGSAATSGGGVVSAASGFAVSVHLEDACSGVVVLFAKDETIQVAAAHDRHCVSVVTWRIGASQTPSEPAKTTTSLL